MELTGKNILLVSPEPWDHIFVSKHHYAITLGQRGNRVYFLNPPRKVSGVNATGYKNVLSVHYKGFVKGLRFYPRILQRHFIRSQFDELKTMCGTSFDLVWSFDNSVFFDFSVLPSNPLAISHIVDLNQNFEFGLAARTADLCLGSSRSIVSKLRQYNAQSHFVNHGYSPAVSATHFQLPHSDAVVRIGYAGNLDLKYIDWEVLQHIIAEHEEVAFFFAGPFSMTAPYAKWLKDRSNVTLLGRLPQADVLAFYIQMDILLLCYRSDQHPGQLDNPHKMMEYLGSGKMVVATYTEEYKLLNEQNLFLMSKSNSEFPVRFREALDDLGYWNNEEKQELRRRWALGNTYGMQIERIENLMSSLRID